MTAASLPLSDGVRDARDSGHALPSEGGHCLSIVHKTSSPSADRKTDARLFQIWPEGSSAIFPGIPNRSPHAKSSSGNRGGKRGKVTTLSDASRTNLKRYLATMKRDAPAFTMALTLPNDFKAISSASVHQIFKIICNRLTASRGFPGVSFVWKRELQRRGALHYHLLIYGIEVEMIRQSFQRWLALQWNSLICASFDAEESGKHLRWHLHSKNMEAVRGNIAGYFAKYLGKPLEAVCEEIPGRWWGKVNGSALPLSTRREVAMPERAAIIAHRIARKLLQKRANEAKHRIIAKASGLMSSRGQPLVSQFELIRIRNRFKHIDLTQIDLDNPPPLFFHDLIRLEWPRQKGFRWGKAKRSPFAKFSKVRLISKDSPTTAARIMKFVGEAMREWASRNPF